jgi:hypothetical protein
MSPNAGGRGGGHSPAIQGVERQREVVGPGANVGVSADEEMGGRTQIIRQQKSLIFFPFPLHSFRLLVSLLTTAGTKKAASLNRQTDRVDRATLMLILPV